MAVGCDHTKPGIVIIGPVAARGGVSAVVHNVLSANVLQGRYRIRLVNTSVYKDGGLLAEIRTVSLALAKFIGMLPFRQSWPMIHIHVSRGVSFYRKLVFLGLAKLGRRKVILHIHTGALSDFYLCPGHPLRSALVNAALRHVDGLVVLGSTWAESLAKRFPRTPIVVLPNPAPRRRPARSGQFCNKRDSARLIFVGFLVRAKGVHDLAEAVAEISAKGLTVQLDYCGIGETEPLLREQVESLGIRDVVSFRGWLDETQLADALARADIFVLPSYSEGLPNALLEAMAAGLPVVCTSVGAIPDVCAHTGGAYLFEPGDIPALVRGLRLLIEDPYLRSEMGRRNLSVVDNMRPELIAREWSQLYSRLLKPGDSRLQH
jgi:glycosyltransferase involved in cell wall biosynthesis